MFTAIRKCVRAVIGFLWELIASTASKRLLFVVTLYRYLKDYGAPTTDELTKRIGVDNEELEQLNRTFGLADRTTALVFPALAFTDRLWPRGALDIQHLERDALIQEILNHTSSHLRYGRESDLRADIGAVLNFLGR
jgi:hypothetical protein